MSGKAALVNRLFFKSANISTVTTTRRPQLVHQFLPIPRISYYYQQAAKMATSATSSTIPTTATPVKVQGDLNNTDAMRPVPILSSDPAYARISLAITEEEDDAAIRAKYRPFLLPKEVQESDWVARLELSTVTKIAEENIKTAGRFRVLVLYGSLRARSFSKLTAYECARILHRLGCDVRVFDPQGLPVKDDVQHEHEKVQELRELSKWSDGHVWVSPEQHGNLTAVFKNQIDWLPLSLGSVRPTQNRTLSILQVNGGSQSFNAVNSLRILGRWMRMFCIPNQSSIPKAWTEFTDAAELPVVEADQALVGTAEKEAWDDWVKKEGGNRLKESSLRERVVDCMEEFVKVSWILRPWVEGGVLGDRYSERREREAKEEKERVRVEKLEEERRAQVQGM